MDLSHVVARLPDAYYRAVRLDLVDVATLDPDALLRSHHDRSGRDDYRLRRDDDRLLDDYRRRCRWRRRRGCSDCIVDHAADHTADNARPEIATAMTPESAAAMVMMTMMTNVMNGSRTETAVMPARSTVVSTGAAMGSGVGKGADCRYRYHYYYFLHCLVPFFLCLCWGSLLRPLQCS